MIVNRPEKGRCIGVGERNERVGIRKDDNKPPSRKQKMDRKNEGIKTMSAFALITSA